MKKVKMILFITLILVLLNISSVLAAGEKIVIEGENTAGLGETKTATVKIISESTKIGALSGRIEKGANITRIESPTAKNGWSLTYNESTGDFVIWNANGSNTVEIMDISYTVASKEGTGIIKMSDVELTTLEYDVIDIGEVTKEITIKEAGDDVDEEGGGSADEVTLSSIKISKKPKKTEYVAGENFDKTGMVVTATYSDGSTKEVTGYTIKDGNSLKVKQTSVTISYTEDGITKTTEQKITVTSKTTGNKENTTKDNTQSDQEINYAGLENYIIPVIIVTLVIAVISYKKYKQF